jgi:Putative phosphatase (DUF442)
VTQLSEITNFVQLTEDIGTSGQPQREQFALIKDAGYDAVINLALPTSDHAIPDEGSVVTGLGMSYSHVPVVFENPTLDNLRTFFGCARGQEGVGTLRRERARLRIPLPVPEARTRARRRASPLPCDRAMGAADGRTVEVVSGAHEGRHRSLISRVTIA